MTTTRAFLLGVAGAVAGGIFGAICGAILCLADGLPWMYAGGWSLRGAFGGLVAGAILGALSGIYHVDDPAPGPASPPKPSVAKDVFVPARRTVALYRNGARPAK